MTKREIDIAEAHVAYETEKPNKGHRVTLQMIASRFGLNVSDLWNFRRGLSTKRKNVQR